MSAAKAKRCPRCGQVKPPGQFYRRQRSLRLSPYCKPCQRIVSRTTQARRRQDPTSASQLRAVDRARQRRHRALRGRGGEDR